MASDDVGFCRFGSEKPKNVCSTSPKTRRRKNVRVLQQIV